MRVRGPATGVRTAERPAAALAPRRGCARGPSAFCSAVSLLDSAVPLHFLAFDDAQESRFLSKPGEVDLYSVSLQPGDELDVNISAQQTGSGLASTLRVFAADGTPLALDNQQGGDPHLVFQAATAGTYFVGVSSAPNNAYNPNVAGSGTAGGTTGLYTLDAETHEDQGLCNPI